MYVSWSDIIAAVVTVLVGIIGLFLLFLKLINWRRRQKRLRQGTRFPGKNGS